jgi:hypothetical protein
MDKVVLGMKLFMSQKSSVDGIEHDLSLLNIDSSSKESETGLSNIASSVEDGAGIDGDDDKIKIDVNKFLSIFNREMKARDSTFSSGHGDANDHIIDEKNKSYQATSSADSIEEKDDLSKYFSDDESFDSDESNSDEADADNPLAFYGTSSFFISPENYDYKKSVSDTDSDDLSNDRFADPFASKVSVSDEYSSVDSDDVSEPLDVGNDIDESIPMEKYMVMTSTC